LRSTTKTVSLSAWKVERVFLWWAVEFLPTAIMVVIAKHEPILRRLGLATLAGVKAFRGEPVKDHNGRRDVFRIVARDAEGRTRVLFLKRNWRPYKKDGLLSLLRRGKVWSIARQEWENSRALECAGLRAAGLVACGEEFGALWEKFSFIITDAAPGQTVEQFLRECRDRAQRRRVFDALAREIRRMHDAGLASPDLFTRHIFVDVAGGDPKFCLIDMARLDRVKRLSARQRARDLALLNVTALPRFVSPRERARFLKTYAGGLDKALARLIARRMAHLLKRNRCREFAAQLRGEG
jgi:tRNA A-37 threonylcarbamoyl transferase component Bud32